MGLLPLGGSCERRKIPSPWEPPSPAGSSAGTDRELQKLREYSIRLAAGRTERNQHRWSLPRCYTSQPETAACWCSWWLGGETRASVDRPRERTWFGCMETTQRSWSVVCTATGGVHRTEPGSAIGALLLTRVQREGCGPAIAASSSACSQRVQLCLSKLWEHTHTGKLSTCGD